MENEYTNHFYLMITVRQRKLLINKFKRASFPVENMRSCDARIYKFNFSQDVFCLKPEPCNNEGIAEFSRTRMKYRATGAKK